KTALKKAFDESEDKFSLLNELREFIHENLSPINQPIDLVRWLPVEQVEPNDYNPNSVAKIEMGLLHTSIKQDGYTQPIVTIFDPDKQKYIIVDGFHRYFVGKNSPDIREVNQGYLPVVVINKQINDRMASTVRHNRARGKHSISGMSKMIFQM